MVKTLVETEPIPPPRPAPVATADRIERDISPEALYCFSRGVSLSHQDRYQDAVEAFDQALEYDKEIPQGWYNKGTALGELGEYQAALEALEQALRLSPDYAEAWHNKGVAFARLGRHREALEAFERKLALRPDDADAWLGKGMALLTEQEPGEALHAFKRALGYAQEEPLIWLSMGHALAGLGRYAEAQEAFQRASELGTGPLNIGPVLYKAWAVSTLALGVNALVSQDVSAFEQAGLAYIDVLEKARQDKASQAAVEQVLVQFRAKLKDTGSRKLLEALEELELFISLMKIKDPFEGWRALGNAISARWPQGLSAVKAVREMRR